MAKTPQLVCQYLENISREALEKYQELVRQYVRHRQGVYALYRRGRLYYVGLAKDLRWRLHQHLRDRHEGSWDRFSIYFTVSDRHLSELESLLLRVVKPKPPGNKQVGKFGKAENLIYQFARTIRTFQRQELAALVGREASSAVRASRRVRPRGEGILAAYVAGKAMALRGDYKGRQHYARVRRDGVIRFGGKLYKSPSHAGGAATGHACNGWWFWKFQRAPGEWVRLRELRR